MATQVLEITSTNFSPQSYSDKESVLITTSEVLTTFTPTSYIESYIYSPTNTELNADYNFLNYNVLNDGQTPLTGDVTKIVIDPEDILLDLGYNTGKYTLHFNFLNKEIGSESQSLFISEISSDRTEIRLDSNDLSNLDIVEQTIQLVQKRETSEYFLDFYVNFGFNKLYIANNIELDNTNPVDPTILIKLYEPLPEEFDLNTLLWVVTTIEEPKSYQVTFEEEPIVFKDTTSISGPNFNLEIKDQINNSTDLLSYNDILLTNSSSSLDQITYLLDKKEININIDYTQFSEFTHFSSAQTRLENFYYKVSLLESYSSSIETLNNTTSSADTSGSKAIYENKISNIIKNFDGYDYYLYYESSSYAWPKTTLSKPYELAKISSTEVINWFGSLNENSPIYGGLILSASLFDNENKDNLKFSIPEYLRDDPNNSQYELFIDMVAQHYDNIWIYHKELTQKYSADNRLEQGISKDIVSDAIKDFGIKLYQNNFSNDDLYTAFLGLTPNGGSFPFPNITGSLPTPTGFEYVDTLISASNNIIPLDDVNKSLYKRIYHNIPYLLKAKGTIPGLRALITSYGIPDTILRINEYGGKDKINVNDWDHWQREFNYAFSTTGSNFISSSWHINDDFPPHTGSSGTPDVPNQISFRFKTNGLPTSNIPRSQSLWHLSGSGEGESLISLRYEGTGYISGSYSGSIKDPFYEYAYLDFYPDLESSSSISASVYLPFFDGGWWSVAASRDDSSSKNFTLKAANKLYNEGDNSTKIGFISSSVINHSTRIGNWRETGSISYFPASSSVLTNYTPFSGSYQEIRYYLNPISENVFEDYTMNPHSIEGNTINSSPNELVFRASLGGELYTSSLSIHPKVTGSWVVTQSFSGSNGGFSNFNFNNTPTFVSNVETFFADQPIAGLRNIIKDKIRIENNVMPEGDTLSPFMSLSQMVNISQSYTPGINYLEVAFSPTNEINEDIMDQIGYFNIGEYIGDPRLRSSSATSYPDLDNLRDDYFEKYTKNYNLKDFIRLIKFFDNSLFKMIKDFVPARTSLASGVVVKQHLLERNKYPQPQASFENKIYTASIDMVAISGGAAGVFNEFNTITNTSQSWYETVEYLTGSITTLHDSQEEFYNGELSGSHIVVSTQNLNAGCDPYKKINPRAIEYNGVRIYSGSEYSFNSFIDNNNHPTNGYISMYYDTIDSTLPIPNPNS